MVKALEHAAGLVAVRHGRLGRRRRARTAGDAVPFARHLSKALTILRDALLVVGHHLWALHRARLVRAHHARIIVGKRATHTLAARVYRRQRWRCISASWQIRGRAGLGKVSGRRSRTAAVLRERITVAGIGRHHGRSPRVCRRALVIAWALRSLILVR